MKLEKDLFQSIKQRLEIYELTGEILWWARLNSLRVKTLYGGIVNGCPKGTPDIVSIVKSRDSSIICLFLELKSSSGSITKEQIEFWSKYNCKEGIQVLEIRDPNELDDWISENAYDFTKDL